MEPQPNEADRLEPAAYELEPAAPAAPALGGQVIVRPTADELIDMLAADLVIHSENCVREFGDFHLAVSGGPIFEPFFRRLMYDPNYRRIPWRRTHLWFVEERCVPFDDERSNFRQVSETIGDHADIPPEQFHAILAESKTAATDYAAQLRETLAWREKGQDRLDCVLLTLDSEGGTVGLAPGVRHEDTAEFVAYRRAAGASAVDAVALTPRLINAARFIAVMATGATLAPVIQRLADEPRSCETLPIRRITPLDGELKWYLDAHAAGHSDGDDDDELRC